MNNFCVCLMKIIQEMISFWSFSFLFFCWFFLEQMQIFLQPLASCRVHKLQLRFPWFRFFTSTTSSSFICIIHKNKNKKTEKMPFFFTDFLTMQKLLFWHRFRCADDLQFRMQNSWRRRRISIWLISLTDLILCCAFPCKIIRFFCLHLHRCWSGEFLLLQNCKISSITTFPVAHYLFLSVTRWLFTVFFFCFHSSVSIDVTDDVVALGLWSEQFKGEMSVNRMHHLLTLFTRSLSSF